MTLFSFSLMLLIPKLHLTKNVGGFFYCVHWDNTCIVSARTIKLEDTEKCDKTEKA